MTATQTQDKSHLELLKLPNKDRGYEFKTIDGKVTVYKKLRSGLRNFKKSEHQNLEGLYQCVYTALFTRKKKHYIKNDVRIKVINYTEYIENLYD